MFHLKLTDSNTIALRTNVLLFSCFSLFRCLMGTLIGIVSIESQKRMKIFHLGLINDSVIVCLFIDSLFYGNINECH